MPPNWKHRVAGWQKVATESVQAVAAVAGTEVTVAVEAVARAGASYHLAVQVALNIVTLVIAMSTRSLIRLDDLNQSSGLTFARRLMRVSVKSQAGGMFVMMTCLSYWGFLQACLAWHSRVLL